MADAPKWTTDPKNYADTRWVYHRDITTITWWPHSSGNNSTHVAKYDTDWSCACGTSNWQKRQNCYFCLAPRTNDHAEEAQQQTSADTPDPKIATNKLDPEKPNTQGNGSGDAPDAPRQQP